VQRRRQPGFAFWFELFHQVEQSGQMRRIAARRQLRDDSASDRVQPDGVALLDREVAEGGAELEGVFEFRDAFRAEAHRTACVDDQAATQIGVRFELFDVEPVATAVRSPVESPQVVARHILSIFGEFDARSAMRAGVAA